MDDFFDNWIYETNDDNSARFILGERGENPLICIGVNPSTATPEKLDPTLTQVRNRSQAMGYDGWLMLNLYPQRATNPDDLHEKEDRDLIETNTGHISDIFRKYPKYRVWAAWGTLITKRAYLKYCLEQIIAIPQFDSIGMMRIGPLSQKGHPHHPLYLPKTADVKSFDIESYLKGLHNA